MLKSTGQTQSDNFVYLGNFINMMTLETIRRPIRGIAQDEGRMLSAEVSSIVAWRADMDAAGEALPHYETATTSLHWL